MIDPFEHGFRYTSESGRKMYKWREAEVAASNGKIPEPPDFSADTHRQYDKLIDKNVLLVTLAARTGDLTELLPAVDVCPGRSELSTTPKAVQRWTKLCIKALRRRVSATETFSISQPMPSGGPAKKDDPNPNDRQHLDEPPASRNSESEAHAPLSVAEAKRRLAVTYGAKPEAIEIIFRF